MMNSQSLAITKQALRLYANPLASRSQVHYNVRNYLNALEYLGSKWVLAENVPLVRRN